MVVRIIIQQKDGLCFWHQSICTKAPFVGILLMRAGIVFESLSNNCGYGTRALVKQPALIIHGLMKWTKLPGSNVEGASQNKLPRSPEKHMPAKGYL